MSKKAYTITYSQNREDLIIAGYFKDVKKGFYVDVGASDPIALSVTKHFYDQGWSGINIEPIPELYNKLVKERPRDINLAVGIGQKKLKAKLHYYPEGSGLSTFSDKMATEHEVHYKNVTSKKKLLTVNILPLSDILDEYCKDKVINFMKIDVEGYEDQVIKGNNWTKYRPQLLCIEADHIYHPWDTLLIKEKYQKVFFDGINSYYLAEEVVNKANSFSYADSVLEKPVIYYTVADELDKLDRYQKKVEQYDNLVALNNANEAKIRQLEHEISRPKLLREAARILAVSVHHANLKLIDKLKPKQERAKNFQIVSDNPQELLKVVQAYDKTNEKAINSSLNLKALPYFVANKSYKVATRSVKKLENVTRTQLHKRRSR